MGSVDVLIHIWGIGNDWFRADELHKRGLRLLVRGDADHSQVVKNFAVRRGLFFLRDDLLVLVILVDNQRLQLGVELGELVQDLAVRRFLRVSKSREVGR